MRPVFLKLTQLAGAVAVLAGCLDCPVPTTIVGSQKCLLSECVLLKYGEAETVLTGCSDSVGY